MRAAPDGTLAAADGAAAWPPVGSLCYEAVGLGLDAPLLAPHAGPSRCVRGGEGGALLLTELARAGLSPREYTEAATFWAPLMAAHAFVQVRLLREEEWAAMCALRVEGLPPGPRRTLRVFIAWRGCAAYDAALDGGAAAAAAAAAAPPAPPQAREGSWVVEWGGVELAAV